MRLSYKTLTLTLALALASALGALAAGEGRMLGTVVDDQGNPLVDVKVTVTSPELSSFEEVRTTKKNGTFSVVMAKAYLKYVYRLEKEGFQTTEMQVETDIGGTTRHTFQMLPGTTASALTDVPITTGEPPASNAVIAIFNQGVDAHKAGDLEGAKTKFEEAIAADPAFTQAYTALAELNYDLKDYQGAVDAAEKALEQNPNSEPALRIRYNSYTRLGQKDKAEEAQVALKAAGQAADEAKRIYNSGVEFHKAGDTANAVTKFEEALAMDPSLTPANEALVQLYYQQKDYPKAITVAERILASNPVDDKALRIRYDAYRELGDVEKLTDALVDLAAIDKEFAVSNLYNLGINAYNDGNIPAAKAMFERVQQIDPSYAKAQYYLGLCYVNDGENAKAKELLQRFIELAPNDPEAATAKEMIAFL